MLLLLLLLAQGSEMRTLHLRRGSVLRVEVCAPHVAPQATNATHAQQLRLGGSTEIKVVGSEARHLVQRKRILVVRTWHRTPALGIPTKSEVPSSAKVVETLLRRSAWRNTAVQTAWDTHRGVNELCRVVRRATA